MALKDLLKKRERLEADTKATSQDKPANAVPEFKFIRTTTSTQEVIEPPAFAEDNLPTNGSSKDKKSRSPFRRTKTPTPSSYSPSTPTVPQAYPTNTASSSTDSPPPPRADRDRDAATGTKLSRGLEKLHIRSHSRTPSASSQHVPDDLPPIDPATTENGITSDDVEAQWEKRATLLAAQQSRSRPASAGNSNDVTPVPGIADGNGAATRRASSEKDASEDVNIQEAVRLHESGELESSTRMFGQLANPRGENNALAQVLYGLALRHGWGVEVDAARALEYLGYAASNSAAVEAMALQGAGDSGSKKGGALKGELVLAIFELGNSYRHGWGIAKDAVAARQYYETAANLGDTDAMNEVAWCYLEGFGGGKDKVKAARYLRMAEEKGVKTIGNSWIWKDKYDPGHEGKSKKR